MNRGSEQNSMQSLKEKPKGTCASVSSCLLRAEKAVAYSLLMLLKLFVNAAVLTNIGLY